MFVKTLALALAIGCAVPYAAGQAAPAPVPNPKPPLSPSQTLLESWNDIGRKLTAMAEDFP